MITSGLVYFLDEDAYPEAIKYVDPCVALASIGLIVVTSIQLGTRLALLLLQCTPYHLSVSKMTRDVMFRFADDVHDIHDFHVWSLVHTEVVASLHVTYKNFEVR
jgi:Co/Zn/Cd efflux system component